MFCFYTRLCVLHIIMRPAAYSLYDLLTFACGSQTSVEMIWVILYLICQVSSILAGLLLWLWKQLERAHSHYYFVLNKEEQNAFSEQQRSCKYEFRSKIAWQWHSHCVLQTKGVQICCSSSSFEIFQVKTLMGQKRLGINNESLYDCHNIE